MRAPEISYADEVDALKLSRALLKAAQGHFRPLADIVADTEFHLDTPAGVYEALGERIEVLDGLIERANPQQRDWPWTTPIHDPGPDLLRPKGGITEPEL